MSFDASLAGLRALDGERLAERLRLVGRCESRLAAVKAETIDALARRDGEARAADVLRNDVKQSNPLLTLTRGSQSPGTWGYPW